MSQKQAGRGELQSNCVNHRHGHPDPHGPEAPSEKRLEGVSRLVNSPSGDPKIVLGEEDQAERDYLERLLHAADEALRHVKCRFFHRTRRGRLH